MCLKLVAMASSLVFTDLKVYNLRSNSYHSVKKIVKIGPVVPDLIGFK